MDIKQAKVVSQWKYDPAPLLGCRFDPKGRWAVSSSEDTKLQRWDLADGKFVVLEGHDSWVHALSFSPEGDTLVSGGCDGRLIWWQIGDETPAAIRSIDAHIGWIRSVQFSPDGKWIVSGGNDNLVRLWDAATGEMAFQWNGPAKHVYCVDFTRDGSQVIAGDLAGQIRMWPQGQAESSKSLDATPLYSYNGGQQVDFGGVRALDTSLDGKQLAAGGLHKATNPLGAVHEPLMMRFDIESGKVLFQHVAEGITGGVIWRCRFLSDGTLMGVSGGSSGGWLLFWNAEQEKDIHRFQLPALARDMDLSADGISVASSHYDRHLRITKLDA